MSTAPRQRTARPAPPARPRRPLSPEVRRRARLRRNLRLLRTLVIAGALVSLGVWGASRFSRNPDERPPKARVVAQAAQLPDSADGIKIGTFLGNEQRRFYGKGPVPERLDLIWKARIGSGWTNRKEDGKPVVWAGAGWTGQPTLVRDQGKLSLIINGYDHRLHRYDAATYRGISFGTGRELWRMPVPKTANYSQDVDASGILVDGKLVEAVEPGYVYELNPWETRSWGKDNQPIEIARSRTLWDSADVAKHDGEPGGSNLCIEGSPAYDAGRIYVSTGSGHVYGLSKDLKVEWDFKTGADFDSTPVVRRDGKLLVGMEREYVAHGGVFMLDPSKPAKDAVVWWSPTEDRGIEEWSGGVVGSVGINDTYDADGTRPALAALDSVDGRLYVVSQDELDSDRSTGPDGKTKYARPKLVFTADIGSSISTPIFVDDYIVTAGYDKKVHVFRVDYRTKAQGDGDVALKSRDGRKWFTHVSEVASFATGGPVEATPIVWKGRIYIASRDGYLYCLGDSRQPGVEMDAATTHGD